MACQKVIISGQYSKKIKILKSWELTLPTTDKKIRGAQSSHKCSEKVECHLQICLTRQMNLPFSRVAALQSVAASRGHSRGRIVTTKPKTKQQRPSHKHILSACVKCRPAGAGITCARCSGWKTSGSCTKASTTRALRFGQTITENAQ